jgi:F-type H+-transporting ATPase subunit gamma
LTQKAIIKQLLPVESSEEEQEEEKEKEDISGGYSFEPSPEEVLEDLIPKYMNATLYGALLNSSTSEHASRMKAMKAATENAEDLVKVLTRESNQARQAEITTEISEIVGGAEALAE